MEYFVTALARLTATYADRIFYNNFLRSPDMALAKQAMARLHTESFH